MADLKPTLGVVNGGGAPRAGPIALSLVVHERKRLDIALHEILGIDAFATQTFSDGRGPVSFDLPHVEIRLTPSMQQKLRHFTKDIVGETMEIHVRDRCVSRPVLREPLDNEPAFHISIYDFADAQALAETLRIGWRPVRVVE